MADETTDDPMEERELIERLTVAVEFARLVLGVLAQRAGGELRISREEIDRFDNDFDVGQYVDEESGELILRLEKEGPTELAEVLAEAISGRKAH